MFQADDRYSNQEIAAALQTAIRSQFGFEVPILVLSNNELHIIVEENSLSASGDPSRLLVAFAYNTAVLVQAKALLKECWKPEALAVGSKAAFLWCPDGIIQSSLAKAFSRATGDSATIRNWATVLKLQQAAGKN